MLELGGLENSAPNTSQTPNKFKVAKNVSFTKDGYITPRSSMEGFTGNTGTSPSYPISRWTHFTSYNDFVTRTRKLLRFGIENRTSTRQKQLFLENVIVPSYNGISMDLDAVYNNNFSDQSVEVDGVKYILSCPNKSNSQLVKYDGFEAAPAGIGSPYFLPVATNSFSATEPGYSTITGSRYVKVVGHSLDMQGNPISSDAVSYRTTGTTQNFRSIASGFTPSGTTIFVGVGDSGISYSYDAVNWDANVRIATNLTNYPLRAVCYGNSLFVALCGDPSLSQAPVLLSEDGINWRMNMDSSVLSIGGGWTSVVWGGNKYVAVRSGAGTAAQRVMTSPDGIVWTYRTATSANEWSSVAYGGSGSIAFVACSTNGTIATQIMTSPDGITWTVRTAAANNTWNSVAYGAGVWVIVGSGIITANAMTSPDGITWTARTTAAATNWIAVTYGTNPFTGTSSFMAVTQAAVTANKLMTSANGITWTGITGPNTLTNSCICYGLVGLKGYFISGCVLSPLQVVQGLIYCDDATPTTWIAVDSPITTCLDLSYDTATVISFLSATSNQPYSESDFAMAQYFYGKATYNSLTNNFDLTTSTGSFDFWGIKNSGQGNIYVIRPISFTITTGVNAVKYAAIAYKFTASGNNFYGDVKIFNPATLLWEDSNGSTLTQASGLFAASRRHYTVWASPSASGIYYYKGIVTAATSNLGIYSARTKYLVDIRNLTLENIVQKASTLPFSISGSLNAWYDVSSVKRTFNSFVSNLESFVSLTLYQGSILLASQDIIYISDYTFGGSLEMTTGLSAVKIGDSEQGKITSIVGTKDYLIVSRERKVYMVAGSIATNNSRIQEIPGIPVGAYSNSCMQEVDGNVILLSSVGSWWINAANAKKLSSGIELNFKTFMKRYINQQPSAEADSIIFDMNDYPANAYSTPDIKKYITCAYDAYRNILVFTDSSTTKCGESLALHLATEEWTNWTSFDVDGYELSAMTFLDGKQYNGTISDTNLARTSNENTDQAVFTYDYSTRAPSRLVTTWMTAGEPSLEKQILQLKMFGYIWSDLDIKHYQNWDLSTAITNATYVSPGSTSPSNYIMFHKQRLNSSKAMAVCIEMLHKTGGKTFWIEGLEVEFDAIQAGMKR
jgi:hypothetical protein